MDMAALSMRTIGERERIVRAIARDVDVADCNLSPELVTRWLRGVNAPSSRSAYFNAIRAWSHFLVREGYRDDDPTIRVPRPRVPRAAPRPLMTSTVRQVLASNLRPETRAQILLCASAGLRVHEAAKVAGSDFQRVSGMFEVVGKGGHRDYLAMNDDLSALAREWPSRGWWFPSPVDPSRPLRPASVSLAISTAFARIGVRATAHQLRHWFATTMLESGVDVRIVQEVMRHRTLATTAIYTGVSHHQRRWAVEQLPRLLPTEAVEPGQRTEAA